MDGKKKVPTSSTVRVHYSKKKETRSDSHLFCKAGQCSVSSATTTPGRPGRKPLDRLVHPIVQAKVGNHSAANDLRTPPGARTPCSQITLRRMQVEAQSNGWRGEKGRVGACRAGAGQPDMAVVRPTRRKRPRAGAFLHAPTPRRPDSCPGHNDRSDPHRFQPIRSEPSRAEPSVSSSRRGAACPNALNARHEQPGPPGHLLFGADPWGRKGKGQGSEGRQTQSGKATRAKARGYRGLPIV
jgi:hypothetical protein